MMPPSTERNALIAAFLIRNGWDPATRVRIAGDASFRKYDRLTDNGNTAILMDAPPPQEDVRPFVHIARHLYERGFSVPDILAEDTDAGLLLLEDLGDDTYTRLLARGKDERALYALATDALIALHKTPDAVAPGVVPYALPRQLEEVGRLHVWYLKMLGVTLSPDAISEFEQIWEAILPHAEQVPTSLILFDYHVDNLLLIPGRTGIKACGLLDFQDAVSGPVTYDFMSLLEDARRDINPALVAEMKSRYLAALPAIAPDAFNLSWAVMAAQRHVRVIGTFARLNVRDNKPHYLVHMPRLWRYMDQCLAHPALSDLKTWMDEYVPQKYRVVPS